MTVPEFHIPPPPPPPPSTSHSQILRVAEITRLYSEEDGKQHIASMKSKLDDYVTCIILFACTSTSSETSVVFFNQKRRHAQSKLSMYMKSLYHVQILMQLKLTISYKTISFISYYYQYPDFLIIKRTLFCSPFKKFHLNVFFVRKWVSFIHVHKCMYHTLSYSDFLKISILIIYMIDERVTQKCFKRQHFSMATHFKSY